MRLIIAVAAVTLLAAPAHSAGHTSNPCKVGGDAGKVRFHEKSTEYSSNLTDLIIHRGKNGKRPVVRGFNVVDEPASFNCQSSTGCLLVATGNVGTNTNGYFLCTIVDGSPINGRFAEVTDPFEDELVSAGNHSVQTKLWAYNTDGTIEQWALSYTLYDQR